MAANKQQQVNGWNGEREKPEQRETFLGTHAQRFSHLILFLPAGLEGHEQEELRTVGKSHLCAQDIQDREAENRPQEHLQRPPLQVLNFRKWMSKEGSSEP